jgi:nucleoside-diphosphate-sugar epimerase
VEGLDVKVLLPGLILGAAIGTPEPMDFLITSEGSPFYPVRTNGFVDVRDVAEFAVRMLDYQGEEEKFLMIGDNIPYKTFLEKIAQHIHKKAPHIVAKNGH